MATNKEAIDALNTYKIDLICLDVLLQGDIPEWNQDWEILLEEAKHRKISVIAITAVNGMNKSYIWQKVKDKEKQSDIIKEVFSKANLSRKQLVEKVKELLIKEKPIMILELLATETVKAGVSFLVEQFGKLTNRVNEEQLAEIKEKAQTAKTEQDVDEIRNLIQAAVPNANQIASISAFKTWVEDTITADFSELIGVGEITVKVLRKVRKNEGNLINQEEIKKMETGLVGILDEFKRNLRLGKADRESKSTVYDAVTRALNFING